MFAILLSEDLDPFYENITSFPTVFFTFVLALCVLFWLGAVLGVVDIDVFHFDAHFHAHFDAPDLGGDVLGGAGSDATTANALAGLMLRLGLNGVPVTVIISLVALLGWLLCYYAVHFLVIAQPGGLMRYLAGLPILLGSLYLAVMVTSVLIKPLRPLFKKTEQETVKRTLGQTAIVRSSIVDENSGEAVLQDGGAGLILKVRASGGSSYARGDRVVLLEYRKAENTYRVISEEEFSG
jgi:hypothetical protein